ncbi:hypothetical protein [Algiphilus sp.]|uniref:hypothetical protein n=1 Tax=Algiphilus sp. TaxID=1872431 RepID=UPI0025C42790|nr:hypothetical protein [Algiphilus sp.]MCK5771483.1 hypothetical protein [Algiphilus sp.]
MKFVTGVFLLVVSSYSIATESLSTKAEARELAESVMSQVNDANMKDGLMQLRPYTVVPVAEFDAQLSQIDMQLPAISQRFGKPLGFDFVEEEMLGESLVQYVYMQKYEKHLMFWRFVFYKPENG